MEPRKKDLATSLGLLVLRVGAGGFMLSHGWGKLQMLRAGTEFADPIGIGPDASLWLVTGAEFLGALLVILGLFTRLGAASIVVAMGVAAFVVHGADPWSAETAAMRFLANESENWASKEPALLFLVSALTLVLTGAGQFSLDAVLAAALRRRRGAD